jgi:hypothetical protein
MRDKTMMKWEGEKVILKGHDTVKRSAMEIAMLIQRDAVMLCAVDQGQTRASISISDEKGLVSGKGQDFPKAPAGSVLVGTVYPSAPFLEFGTGPHKTANGSKEFLSSLKDWCVKHGLADVEFLIVRSIRRRGTRPHPFMRPALDRAKGKDLDMILMENGKREFAGYVK